MKIKEIRMEIKGIRIEIKGIRRGFTYLVV